LRKAIGEAGKAGDADTSDLFTGISRGVDKSLWLLEAHLQADR
jgi:starvation-inducible DNA-binding protein